MRIKRVKKQCASILNEMVVVLPIFLLLGSALIDMGIVFKSQIFATRLAYEGARLASDTSRLPVGDFTFTAAPDVANSNVEHLKLRDKIMKVAEAYNMESEIIKISTSRPEEDHKLVKVTLSIKPRLLFFGSSFPDFAIKAESDGPYLYLDKASETGGSS